MLMQPLFDCLTESVRHLGHVTDRSIVYGLRVVDNREVYGGLYVDDASRGWTRRHN